MTSIFGLGFVNARNVAVLIWMLDREEQKDASKRHNPE